MRTHSLLFTFALVLLANELEAADQHRLVNSGKGAISMPVLALGTWELNDTEVDLAINAGLEVGYTHVDTANNYGNQIAVGNAIRKYAQDPASIFLTTKVPACEELLTANCLEATQQRIAENFEQLAVSRIDLLLLHFPPVGGCQGERLCANVRGTWRALELEYAKGDGAGATLGAIGVSNYCPSCFACLSGESYPSKEWANRMDAATPAVNQVMLHVGMGPDPAGTYPGGQGICSYDAAYGAGLGSGGGVVTQAYSPLGDGTSELITGDLVSGIGAAHNVSGAQVSLQWLLNHQVPLVSKSTSQAHLEEDFDLFGFQLSDAEMAALDAATSPPGNYSFRCTE